MPTGIGVGETGLMPSARIAARPSAIWSANNCRHGRCASCRRSGRSASALSALLRLTSELAPLHAVDVVGRPHRQAGHRQFLRRRASSCSMTMSPEVAR